MIWQAKTVIRVTAILFLVLLSTSVALINKYPVIYPDTGTYIYSGFSNLYFSDRPIFYGLFLRHISLATSLWFVVFMQAIIIIYLLDVTFRNFYSGDRRLIMMVLVVAFLSLFTSYSFTVSILVPDIFSAIGILAFINLCLNQQSSKTRRIVLSVLFTFSLCSQLVNLVIFAILFVLIGLLFVIRKYRENVGNLIGSRILLPLTLFILSFVIIPTTHFLCDRQFKITGATHVFAVNHLIEIGVLDNYLEERCREKNFRICNYKNELGWDFIWSSNSPLQKTGGWYVNKDEYREILTDVYTTPKYLKVLIFKSWEYMFKQCFAFDVVVPGPLLGESPPAQQIKWRFPDNRMEYFSSLQSQGKLEASAPKFLSRIVYIVSFTIFFITFASRKIFNRVSPVLKCAMVLFVLHNIISAFACSNLSTIDDRFQSRLIWLFPFFSVLLLLNLFQNIGSKWFCCDHKP
jgi:hypothetical protein